MTEIVDAEQTTASHDKLIMTTKVFAPFEVFYEGDAYSISAVNATGPFDILPGHHNFICMLVPCTITIQTPKGEKSLKVSHALMYVKADHVDVFVDV
ncbi:MAG: F0F1 ATP synthase subunit epsilon [Candidatus Saccharimonadales bacterium]